MDAAFVVANNVLDDGEEGELDADGTNDTKEEEEEEAETVALAGGTASNDPAETTGVEITGVDAGELEDKDGAEADAAVEAEAEADAASAFWMCQLRTSLILCSSSTVYCGTEPEAVELAGEGCC